MSSTLRLAAAAAIALLASACIIVVDEHGGWGGWGYWDDGIDGSGVSASETRHVDAFHAVVLDVGGDVTVTVGEPASLEVWADDNLLDNVTTSVRGGVLRIGRRRNCRFNAGLRVAIATPELTRFDIDGSGDVVVHNVTGGEFAASIDGSGDLRADGSVTRLEASIDGSGALRLSDLAAAEASVDIDGSGTVHVNVSESLRYSIDGAGDISYRGDPSVRGNINGAGSVRAAR